jgi:uncharacterized protein
MCTGRRESINISGTVPVAVYGLERRRARQKIVIFLVLVTAFSASLDCLRVFVPFGANLIILTWTPRLGDALGMWSVGLAGFIALALVDRSLRDIGFAFASSKYLILAAGIPPTYCAVIYVPVWSLGVGRIVGASVLFAGFQSALIHFPLMLFVAAGEEFGWRGVLVPNLVRSTNFKCVALLPGAIWALWHYPDILFFDYNVGTPPLFALICFSTSLIGLGVFLSWLRIASNSVWPAVVFHGVHNSVILGIFDRATGHDAVTVYVTTEFGLGFAAAGAVIGYLFWTKLKVSVGSTQQPVCTSGPSSTL